MAEPVSTNLRPDPVRPALQTGLYIFLCILPIWLFGRIVNDFLGLFAGSILIVFASALVGNFLCLRIFENAGFENLGMPLNSAAWRNTWTGALLGCGAACLAVLIPLAGGAFKLEMVNDPQINWRSQIFVPFMIIAGAAGEEILFRGYGFQNLLRSFGPFSAILPLGVLFGFMHASNPHATLIGVANTAGFGMLFGYAFVRSHDIWYPYGLHVGWNMTLLFLGVEISGITMKVTPYEMVGIGSPFWTGGEYGPEASVLTTVALVLLTLAVWKVRPVRQMAPIVDAPLDES